MRDHYFYAQSAHEAFSRIQPLAEKITEEATTQSEQGAPWLIRYDTADYSRKTLEQLTDFNSHIWQLRLALMWDYLPSCRPDVLVRCQTSLEEITRYLNDYLGNPQKIQVEWVRRMHKETLPRFLKEIEQAHVLQGGEDLSSRNFVEGVAALAHVGMYVLATEEKAPWEVEITLYQHLYDVFIHEMILFEGQQEISAEEAKDIFLQKKKDLHRDETSC